MKTRYVPLVLAAALLSIAASCPKDGPCAHIEDPVRKAVCLAVHNGQPTPEPSTPPPTATPTSTPATPEPTASATPTGVPTPKPTGVRVDNVPCVPNVSKKGVLHKFVRDAQLAYRAEHPERFLGEQLATVWWDDFYFAVVARLNAGGFVKAVVDDCGGAGICGEIAVKKFDVARGDGLHEQYHVLVSNGKLRLGSDAYRSTCTPAGF